MSTPKIKILLIDDDAALVEMLKDHFEFEGFEVFKALDGVEGIELARSKKPDAVVLDFTMPRMDGLEVCRRLKEDPETKGIPILMLSADAQQKTIQKVLALGAAACMGKPFSIDALRTKVSELVFHPSGGVSLSV
ncbi:MAG: response regulator transcription factor [Elusimicrobiota bacterium]